MRKAVAGGGGAERPKPPLSKSIAVKSEVPIQVLLEEGRTEPERSPWGELPYSPYPPAPPHTHPSTHTHTPLSPRTVSLSQHLPLLALHARPNERSNLTSALSLGGGRSTRAGGRRAR